MGYSQLDRSTPQHESERVLTRPEGSEAINMNQELTMENRNNMKRTWNVSEELFITCYELTSMLPLYGVKIVERCNPSPIDLNHSPNCVGQRRRRFWQI